MDISERYYARQRMLGARDTPAIPFQPFPLFEPSKTISTARAVSAAAFSKSRVCVEVLLFQLGKYDECEANAFNRIHLETQDQVLDMMEKPLKRGVDVVRVSGYLIPLALTIRVREAPTCMEGQFRPGVEPGAPWFWIHNERSHPGRRRDYMVEGGPGGGSIVSIF